MKHYDIKTKHYSNLKCFPSLNNNYPVKKYIKVKMYKPCDSILRAYFEWLHS